MNKDENVPVDSNGIAIYPTEYRVGLSDGKRWYVVAVNKDYVFATPAELTTAERDAWIKEKPLVRLRSKWLTVEPQQSLSDCMTSMKDSVCKLMEELAKLEAKLGGEMQRER